MNISSGSVGRDISPTDAEVGSTNSATVAAEGVGPRVGNTDARVGDPNTEVGEPDTGVGNPDPRVGDPDTLPLMPRGR